MPPVGQVTLQVIAPGDYLNIMAKAKQGLIEQRSVQCEMSRAVPIAVSVHRINVDTASKVVTDPLSDII